MLYGSVDANITELLVWDEESLARHRVEVGRTRLTQSESFGGDGHVWELRARLRSADGLDSPRLLAVEMFLLDEDGGIVDTVAGPTRPGLVGARGVANAQLRASTVGFDELLAVKRVYVRVQSGGPHPDEPAMPLTLNLDEEAFANNGVTVRALRATCSSFGGSSKVFVTVTAQAVIESERDVEISCRALDEAGLPIDKFAAWFPLQSDPEHEHLYFGGTSFEVDAVPARVVASSRRTYDEAEPEAIERKILPDLPDSSFLEDVQDDSWYELRPPSVEEIAQLRALATRLSDLKPTLTVERDGAEMVMTFDETSSVSVHIGDGDFGFGTLIELDNGEFSSVAFGSVPISDLAAAEEEVRQTFREMPAFKADAVMDEQ